LILIDTIYLALLWFDNMVHFDKFMCSVIDYLL